MPQKIKPYLKAKEEVLKLVSKQPLNKKTLCKKVGMTPWRLNRMLEVFKKEKKIRIKKVSYDHLVMAR